MMPGKKTPVTIEDLLRLKKAERPGPEFWVRFESELRAKQLAAIVARRPWWHGMSRVFALVARNHLPIGAVAVLALTWVGVRQFESPFTDRPTALDRQPGRVGSIPSARATLPVEESRIVSVDENAADEDAGASRSIAPAAAPVVPPNSPHIVAIAAARTPAGQSTSADSVASANESMMPASQSLNIDMTGMQANESEASRRFMGMAQGFAVSEAAVHQVTDPLAHMDPISEERRSRLLATALPAVATAAAISSASNQRLVTHLSEDRFYESISRYSGGGDRFSIKF